MQGPDGDKGEMGSGGEKGDKVCHSIVFSLHQFQSCMYHRVIEVKKETRDMMVQMACTETLAQRELL